MNDYTHQLAEAYRRSTPNWSQVNQVEEAIETGDDLAKEIEKSAKKNFPNSYYMGQFSVGIAPSVHIVFFLASDKSKTANKIAENDPAFHRFLIFGYNKDGTPGPKLEATMSQGDLTVFPGEGSHLAFDRVKVGWRKKKGTPEQIAKHFDAYFGKLKKAVKDNMERIPHRDTFKV